MKAVVCAVAVVLICLSGSGDARKPAGLFSALADDVGWFRVSEWGDMKGALTGRRKDDERMFSLAIKYVVAPDTLREFVKEWKKIDKSVDDESGNLRYDLKKTLNDNFMFISCGEWKSYRDWEEHLDSRAVRKFNNWLADNHVMVFLRPVQKVTDDFMKMPNQLDRKQRQERVGLEFRFRIEPGRDKEFVDAWTKVAKSTSQEDGNEGYVLRKSMLDNTEFYANGQWQSWDDLWDHIDSEHFSSLKDFAADKNVFWQMAPVKCALDRWD